jgi:hypothetical protein
VLARLARLEYHFSADSLRSQTVRLNGKELAVGADGRLPLLVPRVVPAPAAGAPAAPVVAAAQSYGFVVLPGVPCPLVPGSSQVVE